jgi:HlyD family secretion protein
MDRELPQEIMKRKKIKRIVIAVTSVFLIIFILCGFRAIIKPTLNFADIQTSIVEYGVIEGTVSATGTVVPKFEQVLTSPIQSTIDNVFLQAGDSVGSGESILKLDMEAIQFAHNTLRDELALQKNKKHQLKLQLEKNQVEIQAHYDIKKLQTQYIESNLEKEKHLFEIGGGNKNSIEQAELNLQIAQRELQLLTNQIDNQKESLETEMRGLDLQIQISKSRLAETERQLALAEARADRNGVVVWVNDNIGSTVNSGDVLARIADLGSFKIEARISDIHASKLFNGCTVKVRINDNDLPGRISNILPAVENGIVKFIVELDNQSDKLLRHNLRVDVYVIVERKENVLRVSNGQFYDGLVEQKVFVVDEGNAVRRLIDIGAANFDFVEVSGDIKEGDELIISDMSKYHHLKEISINRK